MAKHAQPDDGVYEDPAGMVHFEEWSGKFWRRGRNEYIYVGETKLSLGQHPYHWNWYDFFEDMPIGSVVIRWWKPVRKISKSVWEWV